MTNRLKVHIPSLAVLAALLATLPLLIGPSMPAAAQATHEFSATVDPLPSCEVDTAVTGTVTLIGLTADYVFSVELRGDGTLLDAQAFEGHEGYRDGAYDWSVTGDLSAGHELLELSFALYDGDLDLVRDEMVVLNPDCALFPGANPSTPVSPAQSPVPGIPSPGMPPASPAPVSGASPPPGSGVGSASRTDGRLVFGFTAVTVLVLSALAALDRRPEP